VSKESIQKKMSQKRQRKREMGMIRMMRQTTSSINHNAAIMVKAIVEWQEGTEDEEVVDDSDQNYVVLQKDPGPVIDIKV
jgi:hypothetical protein